MKSFRFWRVLSILLGLVICSSCGDDDEFPTFKFDGDGTCYYPSVSAISKESFGETVVGYGWKHVSTYEIEENGECLKKEYYTDLEGAGPHYYYFESATTLKTYMHMDAYPANGFRTSAFEYMDANRVVGNNQHTILQIVSVDKDLLKVVEYLAVRAGGTKVYGYVTYKRMTEQELKECQKSYPVDLSNLRALDISVKEEEVFIKGKEFEFDVLQSNGPYTVEASKEETCDITSEGNHVKVKLLKNGAWITVSDGLRNRMFRLFSTDKELEPTGTDIYDFTYTELTLNKNRELVTPDGYVLNYKFAQMGTKAREEYYGSILSKYNPSGLVLVDADKQARFLVLNRGEIYLKELLPETVLDALAETGEGHAIEYKLELVNASGMVFQILPFKVVYKAG
ncbi:hypothetical protein [Bacteroides sp.]|uniref:hypothetical protein n=1 Tax=Bacteroides sp. TaxID=29523 RepID=UPI002605C071|nr:hypothetical protein [Bacteroides sp.]